MNFKIISTLTFASVCCLSTVNADTFSYSYIEGGIGDYIDDAEDPTFLIGGSYNLSSNFNLLGDYSTTTLASEGSVDLDYDTIALGVGFHTPMNEKTDFIASLKYVSIDLSVTSGFASAEVADADGYSIGAGVRHELSDKVEANLGLDYTEIDDASETTITVGGRYFFNEKLSAALSYQSGEDDNDGIAGTIRYNFK